MFRFLLLASLLASSGTVVAQTASPTSTGARGFAGRVAGGKLALQSPSPSSPDPALLLAKSVPVAYPEAAQQTNTQGYVVVGITVAENGDVESVEKVLGDPELVGAVEVAVKQWKFQPIIKDGTPTNLSTTLSFRFAVNDGACTNGVKGGTVTTPFEHRATVAQDEMQKLLCKKVAPVRSHMAELARVGGDVVMAARVGKDGTMQNLRILSSASPLLNQAALEAARHWRYRPYLVSGEPVEVETTIKINFQ